MEYTTYFACVLLFVWTTLFDVVLSADYCYNGYHFKTYYCEYGCCGSGLDQYCCAYSLAALIAGCVVGVLILIAFLVFVWLYYLKRKKQAGRVIAPGTTTTTTVAVVNGATLPNNTMQNTAATDQTKVTSMHYTGQTYPMPQYGHGYPPNGSGPAYPPPYQQTYPPHATSQQVTQPAYPPVPQPPGQIQYPPGPPPGTSMYQ